MKEMNGVQKAGGPPGEHGHHLTPLIDRNDNLSRDPQTTSLPTGEACEWMVHTLNK